MSSIIKKYIFEYEHNNINYDRFKGLNNLQLGNCYELAEEMFNRKKLTNNDSIAYGYLKDEYNAIFRHCFIIDENDKVLDPLRLNSISYNTSIDISKIKLEYYIIKQFSIEDYKRILKNKNKIKNLNLKSKLFKEEKYLIKNVILKNNFIINYYDYNNFIRKSLRDINFDTRYLDYLVSIGKKTMFIDVVRSRNLFDYQSVIDKVNSNT